MEDLLEVIAPEVEAQDQPVIEKAVAEPAEKAETVREDGRKVPAYLRDYFKDPAHKEDKEAWHQVEAYKGKLTGGMKQLEELLGLNDEIGGKQGYEAKQQELAELASLRDGLTSGDPKSVSEFAESSPDGFNKLAPVVAAKWAQTDPDGYQRTMSGVWASTIAQSGVPLQMRQMEWNLNMLADSLNTIPGVADNPIVQRAFKGLLDSQTFLNEWSSSFGMAAEAPAKQAAPESQANPDRDELIRLKNEKFTSELSSKTDGYRTTKVSELLKPYVEAQAKNPDLQDLKDMAVERITNKLHAAMGADPEFKKNQQGLMAKRDVAGLAKLYESRASVLLPEIVAKDARLLFGSPVKAAEPAAKKVALPKRESDSSTAPKRRSNSWDDLYDQARASL